VLTGRSPRLVGRTLAGGNAVACVASAEDAAKIVSTALGAPWNKAKKIDVFIANAGILRDKSFAAMTVAEWDAVMAVHLRATFKGIQGVWEGMQQNGGGRIVTTCSGVGIFGNFGQANYSTAKAAILGLTRTLALEGRKYNILVNCIAPSAGTAMTKTIWPQEMVDAFKPDYVAPLVGYLASTDCETTGELFEVSGGWAAKVRWERSGGVGRFMPCAKTEGSDADCLALLSTPRPQFGFPNDRFYTAEELVQQWPKITAFGQWPAQTPLAFDSGDRRLMTSRPTDDGRTTHPTTTQEAMQQVVENFDNKAAAGGGSSSSSSGDDPEDPELVREAKRNVPPAEDYTYVEKDVILYNLGVGATERDLQWTYEGHDTFGALPTFGVIPGFAAGGGLSFDWIPNFNPVRLRLARLRLST
jgi:multifunctional beta-oxidation protein